MSENELQLHIRSPLIQSLPLAKYVNANVYLKLENTQPSGSFKLRGIGHFMKKAVANGQKKFVLASGGNAGLAATYCARKLGIPVTVCVPHSTAKCSVENLKAGGANVIIHGNYWDDSNQKALEISQDPECTYIHPYDHLDVWDGTTSLIEEAKEDLPVKPDLVVGTIGGGGLLCGVVRGLEKVGWADVPFLGMETLGCNSYNNAVKQGKLVSLGSITSIATCLAVLTPAEEAFNYFYKRPILSEVITDRQCIEACSLFLDDHRMLIEPACGAALASVYSGVITKLQEEGRLPHLNNILVVVCGGAGISLPLLQKFRSQVGLS